MGNRETCAAAKTGDTGSIHYVYSMKRPADGNFLTASTTSACMGRREADLKKDNTYARNTFRACRKRMRTKSSVSKISTNEY